MSNDVKVGDYVYLAERQTPGFQSPHRPTSGIVVRIKPVYYADSGELSLPVINIENVEENFSFGFVSGDKVLTSLDIIEYKLRGLIK